MSKRFLTDSHFLISDILSLSAIDKKVDVHNLAGVRVRSNVSYSDSVEGLPKGIYIINNKKVIAK